jgi:hypothetical protein
MCKTLKEWMRNQFEPEELADMVRHGVSGGFGGLTYYRETAELYQKYKSEIWDMLLSDAENCGENVFRMISQFNWAKNIGGVAQVENLLVWYAAEGIASELIQGNHDDEGDE